MIPGPDGIVGRQHNIGAVITTRIFKERWVMVTLGYRVIG